MNERYICKGKWKDNGEWIEGNLLVLDYDEYRIATSCLRGDDENLLNVCAYEVIPETVRQCTGKKDKDGIWIFEKDIIRTKRHGASIGRDKDFVYDIFEVVYTSAAFKIINANRAFSLDGKSTDYDIIGNSVDNPELLEVER